jgi:hypothetical protein
MLYYDEPNKAREQEDALDRESQRVDRAMEAHEERLSRTARERQEDLAHGHKDFPEDRTPAERPDEVSGRAMEEPADDQSSISVRYPDITVELTGHDGNAFAIMGRVQQALRRAGVPAEERDRFRAEAMSGDYDHLLQTCMRWVEVA